EQRVAAAVGEQVAGLLVERREPEAAPIRDDGGARDRRRREGARGLRGDVLRRLGAGRRRARLHRRRRGAAARREAREQRGGGGGGGGGGAIAGHRFGVPLGSVGNAAFDAA